MYVLFYSPCSVKHIRDSHGPVSTKQLVVEVQTHLWDTKVGRDGHGPQQISLAVIPLHNPSAVSQSTRPLSVMLSSTLMS